MKSGSVSTALLGVCCVCASAMSMRILGPGPWAYALALSGIAFAASPYVGRVRPAAKVCAMLCGVLSLLGVLLVLLAATTGGSFRLPNDQAALMGAFFGIGIFGIAAGRRLR